MREEGEEGKKRMSRLMRLELSGGGILVLGGVIVATAWAARRSHVNRERNKRRTTQGGEEEEYDQKEKKEEEVNLKDGSKDIERFGEISAAVDDDGLVEIKKVGSTPLIEEQTPACNFDDGGTELCVFQSHTEKTEEESEKSVEKNEMVVDHVEQVGGKDGSQEVGENKTSACNEEDKIGDEKLFGHAFNQGFIHVEDDTKQVEIINGEDDDTKQVVIQEERSVDQKIEMVNVDHVEGKDDSKEVVIHGEDELCLHQSLTEKREEELERSVEDGGQEVGEDKVISGCNEEDGCEEVGEWTKISKEEDVQEDQIGDEKLFGHAFNQVVINGEDDTKQVEIHGEDDTKQVIHREKEEEEMDPSLSDIIPKDKSYASALMANVEVVEEEHPPREI